MCFCPTETLPLANYPTQRFFAFAGTQVSNTPATTSGSQSTDLPKGPNPPQLLYISLSFGFSLAVNAWVFYRISGGLFNPAVSSEEECKAFIS
jgi:glycerol uptake facilitator-like aquaporin